MRKIFLSAFAVVSASVLVFFIFFWEAGDKLKTDFINPPHQARVQAFWHWQGPYFTKEGITKDLEAMKEAGLGAALVLNLGSNTRNNPWPENTYRGQNYWDALLHAAKEAERLGMTIGIANAPGYTGTGGPWISESQSMRQLVWTTTEVEGNKTIEVTLPQPLNKPSGYQAYKVKEATLYEDIAVYAIPDKKQFSLKDMINLTDLMNPDGEITWNSPEGKWSLIRMGYIPTMVEGHPIPDDLFNNTLEADKLDREANVYHWNNVLEPLKLNLGEYFGSSFNTILIESYECGTMNWTPKFREQFLSMKGYDPVPWLLSFGTPVLGYKPGQFNGPLMNGEPRNELSRIIENEDRTNRFDWDFTDVVSRLYNDNILLGRDMMNSDKIMLAYEAYNGPFNTAEGMATADIPVATFWTRNDFDMKAETMNGTGIISRSISGGGRAAGRKILAAESFTSLPGVSKWTEVPSQLKFIADGALSSGVNQMMLHQWVHQPFSDKFQPGMTNHLWGTHFSRYQTWFEPGKAFFDYINRCQAMLQQGEEVIDCLSLEDASRAIGNTDLISYNDFLNDSTKVIDGRIVLSSGRKYYYLIGPMDGVVLPEVAAKLYNLVQDGATIVAGRFSRSPSMKNFPICDEEVQEIAEKLWGNPKYSRRICKTEKEAIENLSLQPDFLVIDGNIPDSVRVLQSNSELGDIDFLLATGNKRDSVRILHRNSELGDIYFVVNRSASPQNLSVSFRIENLVPELWQAEDMSIMKAPVWEMKNGRTTVALSLKGQQSVFVVFQKSKQPKDHITSLTVSDTSAYWDIRGDGKLGKYNLIADKPISAVIKYDSGKEKVVMVEGEKATSITGEWSVSFAPKLGQKFELLFPELIDFSKHNSKDVNYFSGTATFHKQISIDKESLSPQNRIILDLGKMYDIATVKVNNQSEIVVWYPPYKIDITEYVKAGINDLEIAVTNSWANAVIGDEQIPADINDGISGSGYGIPTMSLPDWVINGQPRPSARKTFAMWNYYNEESPLRPAGLVGPVRLLISNTIEL